jgi:hypothetical protein
MYGEGVVDPELSDGEIYHLVLPGGGHARQV